MAYKSFFYFSWQFKQKQELIIHTKTFVYVKVKITFSLKFFNLGWLSISWFTNN